MPVRPEVEGRALGLRDHLGRVLRAHAELPQRRDRKAQSYVTRKLWVMNADGSRSSAGVMPK